jgi:hypothetical protein
VPALSFGATLDSGDWRGKTAPFPRMRAGLPVFSF